MSGITIIGWIGTLIILSAYLLAASGKLAAHHPKSLLLNVLGCILLCIQMFSLSIWNALFLNITWGSIALITLFRQHQKRKNTH